MMMTYVYADHERLVRVRQESAGLYGVDDELISQAASNYNLVEDEEASHPNMACTETLLLLGDHDLCAD